MNKKGALPVLALTASLITGIIIAAIALFGFGTLLGASWTIFANANLVAIIIALILGGFIIFRIFRK